MMSYWILYGVIVSKTFISGMGVLEPSLYTTEKQCLHDKELAYIVFSEMGGLHFECMESGVEK